MGDYRQNHYRLNSEDIGFLSYIPNSYNLKPVGWEIVFSGAFVDWKVRIVCHFVAQLPVCGNSCLYTLNDPYENPGIIAIGFWGKKEEYIHWNDCSPSGELDGSINSDPIYYKNDLIRKTSIIHALTMRIFLFNGTISLFRSSLY
jgi:hypothetical protein